MTARKPIVVSIQVATALLLAVGCGPEASSPETSQTTEATNLVQGEPIVPQPAPANAVAGLDSESGQEATAYARSTGSNTAPASVTSGGAAQSAASSGLIPSSPLGYQVAATAPTNVEAGYAGIGFDTLSGYEFDLTDDLLLAPPEKVAEAAEKTRAQIPEKIHALNGEKVAVMGFMLPLKVDAESGLVTEFLIMRDQSACCYGSVPKINEWISVTMVGKGVRPMMDQPITLYGKLHVGETRENGYLVGIYRLDGEKMAGPQDL